MTERDWPRYAEALDLRLAGWPLFAIGDRFGISRERARQILIIARRRLAYRVFVGVSIHCWRFDRNRGCWVQE